MNNNKEALAKFFRIRSNPSDIVCKWLKIPSCEFDYYKETDNGYIILTEMIYGSGERIAILLVPYKNMTYFWGNIVSMGLHNTNLFRKEIFSVGLAWSDPEEESTEKSHRKFLEDEINKLKEMGSIEQNLGLNGFETIASISGPDGRETKGAR